MTDKSEMIFGVRAVIEAIQAGKEIDKILVKKDIQSDLSKELFAALKGSADSCSACSGGTYQPHHTEESSGCGCLHFLGDLSEDGRPRSFLIRARQESVFCDAGWHNGCA